MTVYYDPPAPLLAASGQPSETFVGTLGGASCTLLFDTGATGNYVSAAWAKMNGMHVAKSKAAPTVTLVTVLKRA